MKMSDRTYAKWTLPELALLRDNWTLYASCTELAEKVLPRHTHHAVKNKAKEIGLPARPRLDVRRGRGQREVWWALEQEASTYADLVRKTGLSYAFVVKAVVAFKQARVVHIDHYLMDSRGRSQVPVWCAGENFSRRQSQGTWQERRKLIEKLRPHQGNPFAGLITG
jgi:hypothetical protein